MNNKIYVLLFFLISSFVAIKPMEILRAKKALELQLNQKINRIGQAENILEYRDAVNAYNRFRRQEDTDKKLGDTPTFPSSFSEFKELQIKEMQRLLGRPESADQKQNAEDRELEDALEASEKEEFEETETTGPDRLQFEALTQALSQGTDRPILEEIARHEEAVDMLVHLFKRDIQLADNEAQYQLGKYVLASYIARYNALPNRVTTIEPVSYPKTFEEYRTVVRPKEKALELRGMGAHKKLG